MSDPAREIGAAILEALRSLPAANTVPPPTWVRLGAEAERRGMATRQLRAWCLAHGVEVRDESTRIAWVQPAAIDAAIAGLPVAMRPPSRRARSERERELDAAIDGRAARR